MCLEALEMFRGTLHSTQCFSVTLPTSSEDTLC